MYQARTLGVLDSQSATHFARGLFAALGIMKWSFLTGALAVIPAVAGAACLSGNLQVEAEFRVSPVVVIANVVSEKPASKSKNYLEGTKYKIKIAEVLRGKPGKTMTLFSENSSGRFPMKVGESYLLFVHKELGLWQVDNCGNSAPTSSSTQNIAVLRAQAK